MCRLPQLRHQQLKKRKFKNPLRKLFCEKSRDPAGSCSLLCRKMCTKLLIMGSCVLLASSKTSCSHGGFDCSMRQQFEAEIRKVQNDICAAVEEMDGGKFHEDAWTRPGGGGGISRVLQVSLCTRNDLNSIYFTICCLSEPDHLQDCRLLSYILQLRHPLLLAKLTSAAA